MKVSTPTPAKKRASRNNGGGATAAAQLAGDALDRRALLSALTRWPTATSRSAFPATGPASTARSPTASTTSSPPTSKMAKELARVGQVVGREGKTRQRMSFDRSGGAWGEMQVSFNTLIDDLVRPMTELTSAVTAVAQGNLLQTVRLDVEGRPLEGEFLRSATIVNTMIKQLSRVHVRSDARRARGRHRRQARRPGAGAGSERRVEGPDRKRQPDGEQPDRPGAQHLRGHDRGGQRRPVAQDHGRRARRDPAAQGSHQHDGRPAALVRLGSDARGARGRHRRPARRPGGGAGRGRHVEGLDRQRQPARGQPHDAGAQHRRSDDRRRARRPVAQDHRRRQSAKCSSSRTPSTRWSTSSTRSRRK